MFKNIQSFYKRQIISFRICNQEAVVHPSRGRHQNLHFNEGEMIEIFILRLQVSFFWILSYYSWMWFHSGKRDLNYWYNSPFVTIFDIFVGGIPQIYPSEGWKDKIFTSRSFFPMFSSSIWTRCTFWESSSL